MFRLTNANIELSESMGCEAPSGDDGQHVPFPPHSHVQMSTPKVRLSKVAKSRCGTSVFSLFGFRHSGCFTAARWGLWRCSATRKRHQACTHAQRTNTGIIFRRQRCFGPTKRSIALNRKVEIAPLLRS